MFSVHMQYICKLWIKQIDLASEGMNFNFELIRNLFTNTTPTPTMPTHLTIWAVVEISGIGTIVALFHSLALRSPRWAEQSSNFSID